MKTQIQWKKIFAWVSFGATLIGAFVIAIGFTLTRPRAEVAGRPVINDATTAIEIAQTLLVARYGSGVLEQKPFRAELNGGSWIVKGTLHCPTPQPCSGGVAHVELSRRDGAVKDIAHRR